MTYVNDFVVDMIGLEHESQIDFLLAKLRKLSREPDWEVSSSEWISPDDGGPAVLAVVFALGNIEWSNWVSDVNEISKLFPKITIEVERSGEDTFDLERLRSRAGFSEVVQAVIVFPDFKEVK